MPKTHLLPIDLPEHQHPHTHSGFEAVRWQQVTSRPPLRTYLHRAFTPELATRAVATGLCNVRRRLFTNQ